MRDSLLSLKGKVTLGVTALVICTLTSWYLLLTPSRSPAKLALTAEPAAPLVSSPPIDYSMVSKRERPTNLLERNLHSEAPDLNRPLIQELEHASNYRAFLEHARTRPELGGLFYEQHVMNICFGVQALLKSADQVPGARFSNDATAVYREEAIRKLSARCQSFLPSEVELVDANHGAAARQLRSSRDPMLAAFYKLLASKSTGFGALEATKEVIAFRDPILLQKSSIGLSEDGHYFDGVRYSSNAQSAVFRTALLLIGCHLGQLCGAEDFLVLDLCATQGACAKSRVEMAKLLLALEVPNRPELAAEAEALSIRMAEAVRLQEASKFVSKGR